MLNLAKVGLASDLRLKVNLRKVRGLIVIAAILIERRIEDVKALRQIFETWE